MLVLAFVGNVLALAGQPTVKICLVLISAKKSRRTVRRGSQQPRGSQRPKEDGQTTDLATPAAAGGGRGEVHRGGTPTPEVAEGQRVKGTKKPLEKRPTLRRPTMGGTNSANKYFSSLSFM